MIIAGKEKEKKPLTRRLICLFFEYLVGYVMFFIQKFTLYVRFMGKGMLSHAKLKVLILVLERVYYVTQTGLGLPALLPLLPKCQDYRHVHLAPASTLCAPVCVGVG